MIGPKISHDPGFKMGRDRVLNPPESGFSHELPDNDSGSDRHGERFWMPGQRFQKIT